MNTTGGRKVSKADLLELARALGDDEVTEDESMLCIFQRALDRARELNAPAKMFDGRPVHPKVREWCGSLMDYADERLRTTQARGDQDAEKWYWYVVFGSVRDSTGRPCVHHFAPGSHKCMRGNCYVHIDAVEVDETCSHKFVDSKTCLRCGVSANVLQAKQRLELERLEATGPRPMARAIVEATHELKLPPLALVEDRSVEQLKADGDFVEPCEHAGELAIDRATGEEWCSDCELGEEAKEMQRRQDTMVNHCLHTLYDGSTPACPDCGQSLQAVIAEDKQRAEERQRANAEQWARTRGSKGGATHA